MSVSETFLSHILQISSSDSYFHVTSHPRTILNAVFFAFVVEFRSLLYRGGFVLCVKRGMTSASASKTPAAANAALRLRTNSRPCSSPTRSLRCVFVCLCRSYKRKSLVVAKLSHFFKCVCLQSYVLSFIASKKWIARHCLVSCHRAYINVALDVLWVPYLSVRFPHILQSMCGSIASTCVSTTFWTWVDWI